MLQPRLEYLNWTSKYWLLNHNAKNSFKHTSLLVFSVVCYIITKTLCLSHWFIFRFWGLYVFVTPQKQFWLVIKVKINTPQNIPLTFLDFKSVMTTQVRTKYTNQVLWEASQSVRLSVEWWLKTDARLVSFPRNILLWFFDSSRDKMSYKSESDPI